MEENNSKKFTRDLLNILIIIAIVALCGILIYKYFSRHQSTHSVPAEESTVIDSITTTEEYRTEVETKEPQTKTQATGQIIMTTAEWNKYQKEVNTLKATVHTLQAEITTLKSEYTQLKKTVEKSAYSSQKTVTSQTSVSSSQSAVRQQTSTTSYRASISSSSAQAGVEATQQSHSTSTSQEKTSTNQTDVALTHYTHDSYSSMASLSLKNNTTRTINSITGRILYYDMKGNMLDYQDFTEKITIEPDMVKSFELEGYGHKDYYAYYKSKVSMSYPDRKYKVEFQLKNVTYSNK